MALFPQHVCAVLATDRYIVIGSLGIMYLRLYDVCYVCRYTTQGQERANIIRNTLSRGSQDMSGNSASNRIMRILGNAICFIYLS